MLSRQTVASNTDRIGSWWRSRVSIHPDHSGCSGIGSFDRGQNIGTVLFHIIVESNGDRFNVFLRSIYFLRVFIII